MEFPKVLKRKNKVEQGADDGDDDDDGFQEEEEDEDEDRKDADLFLTQPTELRRVSLSVPLNRVSLKLYGSVKGVELERSRHASAGKWIIHPFSNFRFIWDCASLFMLLLNLILIPFGIAFYKGEEIFWLLFKVVLGALGCFSVPFGAVSRG